MSGKTKILSFLLVLLLSIPFVLSPSGQGNVLGVNEDRSNASLAEGQIAGGVIDTKQDQEKMEGKVLLSKDNSNRVKSNKLSLSTPVKVQTTSGSLNLVVEEKVEDLPEDVLLVVGKDDFIKLGGDLNTGELNVTLIKN
jgi:hypothetical protein